MRHAILGLAAATLSACPLSAQPPTPDDPTSNMIVVTARPLAKLEADLRACLERGCLPAEDMRLSLEVAEGRFVAGAYRDARSTLKASIMRNRGHAKAHAPLLASLHRASARINQHYGDRGGYMRSTYEIARTLRQAYPEDSPQLFFARLEAADMLVRAGDIRRALRAYGNLASQAERTRQPRQAMIVELRLAWLEMLAGREVAGEKRLRDVVQAAANDSRIGLNADVMLLRVARLRGREADANALVRSIVQRRSASGTRPQLLAAPLVDLDQAPERIIAAADDLVETDISIRTSSSSPEHTWIDVGFWITPDGRVSEAEVLRAAQDRERWWHGRVLAAVSRRQYSPYASPDGQPGVYRIERFTLNSWLMTSPRAGSRVATRDGRLKVESLDLTPETVALPAS